MTLFFVINSNSKYDRHAKTSIVVIVIKRRIKEREKKKLTSIFFKNSH
jgi:hypothetical protein